MGNTSSSSSSLPSLTKWVQGNNSGKKDPFIRIVYISRILSFVAEEIFEAVRLSHVCSDWREAVMDYSDEMWYIVCRNIQQELGFQNVFLRICQSDQLSWTLRCCYRQRKAASLKQFMGKEVETDQAMLPIDFRFVKIKPALFVAVRASQPEVTKLLCELGADVSQKALQPSIDSDLVPLEVALKNVATLANKPDQNGKESILDKLSLDNSNTNKQLSESQKALQCAFILMQHGALKSYSDEALADLLQRLLARHVSNEDDIFKVLLDNQDFYARVKGIRKSKHTQRETLLQVAAHHGQIKIMEWILKRVEEEIRIEYRNLKTQMLEKAAQRNMTEEDTAFDSENDDDYEIDADHVVDDDDDVIPSGAQRLTLTEEEYVKEEMKKFLNEKNTLQETVFFFRPAFGKKIDIQPYLYLFNRFPPESKMIDIFWRNKSGKSLLHHLICESKEKTNVHQWDEKLLPLLEKILQQYGANEEFVNMKTDLSPGGGGDSRRSTTRTATATAATTGGLAPTPNLTTTSNINNTNNVVTRAYPHSNEAIRSNLDKTALILSCLKSNREVSPDVLRMMLKYCRTRDNIKTLILDVNDRDAIGMTALHYAASQGSLEKCKLLIEGGDADVNIEYEYSKKYDYYTGYGSENPARAEEKNDAQKKAEDLVFVKKTALDFAMSTNNKELIEYLKGKMMMAGKK